MSAAVEEKTWNAKITNVSLTMADHGCLTFYITLDGGGVGCNFGGYSIGTGYLGAKDFSSNKYGLEAIMRIMDTVGVEKWEDLKGQYVRVVDPGLGRSVNKIGHITKNKWFDIKEFFENCHKEEPEKPIPKDVDELREFVKDALNAKYGHINARTISQDIIVHVEDYHNGRNDVWIQFPYFHSR